MAHLKSLVSNYIETSEKIKIFREVQYVANIILKSKYLVSNYGYISIEKHNKLYSLSIDNATMKHGQIVQ